MTVDPSSSAGPSTPRPVPGLTPYHESSQYRHWRYSPGQLASIREDLNKKSIEVVSQNAQREKEAQQSLGHTYTEPPASTTYLSVQDELLLLRFYVSQTANICRAGFGLPESVESTAIAYLKRFYLKNSVMEWHPKQIMPTCLYLACKTTNHPILLREFLPKISKLKAEDITDTEFLVAQSLSFEFWVRGAEKGVRGWGLDLQTLPQADVDLIQSTLSIALKHLQTSRLTDAEFLFSPSQIALACWHLANPSLVEQFLDWQYGQHDDDDDDATGGAEMYGVAQKKLLEIVKEVEDVIQSEGGGGQVDLKKVKEVDKRLRACSNPEKVPGTALYAKRKQELATAEAAHQAAKAQKRKAEQQSNEMVFGDVIQIRDERTPLSPSMRVKVEQDRGRGDADGVKMEGNAGGMGIKDEGGAGNIVGGRGLKDVGKELD